MLCLWRLDADAMKTLSGIGPLTLPRIGVRKRRPAWFEAAVNGVRSPSNKAGYLRSGVKAARIVGPRHLPDSTIGRADVGFGDNGSQLVVHRIGIGADQFPRDDCSICSAARWDTPRLGTRFGIRS